MISSMTLTACRDWRHGKLFGLFGLFYLPKLTRGRYANAAVNLVSDVVTALLPIGVIRSLEIPKRQKNLLYLVFCVGLM
jgi:hypothetical protein